LLVVVAIIAVLIAIILPATQAVRQAALKAVSSSNLRQLGIAVNNREAQVDKTLPPGNPRYDPATNFVPKGPTIPQSQVLWTSGPFPSTDFSNAKPGAVNGGIFYVLLPYLEQDALFNTGKAQGTSFFFSHSQFVSKTFSYYSAGRAAGARLKIFEGPADPTYSGFGNSSTAGITSYLANAELLDHSVVQYHLLSTGSGKPLSTVDPFVKGWAEKGLTYQEYKLANLPDGVANTVLFAEGYAGQFGEVFHQSEVWTSTYSAPPGLGGKLQNRTVNFKEKLRLDIWNMGKPFNNGSNFSENGPVFHLSNSKFQVRPKVGNINPPITSSTYSNGNSMNSVTKTVTNQAGSTINLHVPQGNFAGGLLVCMCDGSVRFVSQGVSFQSWKAALLPADNQVPGSDF
jgi:type II secretory pathway pseudopilin PulG